MPASRGGNLTVTGGFFDPEATDYICKLSWNDGAIAARAAALSRVELSRHSFAPDYAAALSRGAALAKRASNPAALRCSICSRACALICASASALLVH